MFTVAKISPKATVYQLNMLTNGLFSYIFKGLRQNDLDCLLFFKVSLFKMNNKLLFLFIYLFLNNNLFKKLAT